MTGFSFIETAKTNSEVIFWYLAILTFAVFTILNVHGAVVYYISKPTKVQATFVTGDGILPTGNLTLSFDMPFTEFAIRNPTHFRYSNNLDASSLTSLDQLACSLYNPLEVPNAEHELKYMFRTWLDFKNNWGEMVMTQTTSTDLSSQENLQLWEKTLKESSRNLSNFLKAMTTKALDEKTKTEFFGLLDAPMMLINNAHVAFLSLDAIKTGVHPQEKLIGKLSTSEYLQLTGQELQMANSSVQKPLIKFNDYEVWKTAQQYLSLMLHVKITGEPQSQTFLQDWQYEQDSEGNVLACRVKLKVVMPQGSTARELKIEVRSYTQMWLQYILDTLNSHYATLGRNTEPFCNGQDIATIRQKELEAYKLSWAINSNLLMLMQTQAGNVIDIPQFVKDSILVHSRVEISSLTDNCFQDSFVNCVGHCETNLYIEACDCVPWNHFQLETTQMCSMPCSLGNQTSKCEQECEQRLLHPCHATVYELHKAQKFQKSQLPFEFILMDAQVTMGQHLKYTESYDLTFGSFIGQLGGLLDLWLGINLLSVIHLLTFLVKLCGRMQNKKQTNKVQKSTMMTNLENIARVELELNMQLASVADEIEHKIKQITIQK